MGLQYYDINLAVNKTTNIPAEGRYFRYYSGNAGGADSSVLVKSDTSALVAILKPGQSIRVPENVKTWHIANYRNAGTISGIVVIGDGEISDDQVTGTVEVVNGELNRVKAGQCFIGLAASGDVAGQYSASELWNPAGSGKNLIMNKASVMSGVANSPFWMTKHNAALAGLSALVTSKLLGGAAPVGELRTAANAAMVGSLIGNFGAAGAYDSRDFPFSEPVIIPPGNGVIFQLALVNSSAWVTFQWNEEAA